MITFSLNVGQCVSPNQLGRYVCLYLYREHSGLWLMHHLGLLYISHWPGDLALLQIL